MSLTMSKTERESFLAGLHVGIVSIPRSGRGPLTVPIWYAYEPGGDVWMVTGRDSVKGRLLQAADRISLCAQTEQAPYEYVSIEGPFIIKEIEDGQLETMAIRYYGDEAGRAYAANAGSSSGSVVVSITPESWFSVDYNKRP